MFRINSNLLWMVYFATVYSQSASKPHALRFLILNCREIVSPHRLTSKYMMGLYNVKEQRFRELQQELVPQPRVKLRKH